MASKKPAKTSSNGKPGKHNATSGRNALEALKQQAATDWQLKRPNMVIQAADIALDLIRSGNADEAVWWTWVAMDAYRRQREEAIWKSYAENHRRKWGPAEAEATKSKSRNRKAIDAMNAEKKPKTKAEKKRIVSQFNAAVARDPDPKIDAIMKRVGEKNRVSVRQIYRWRKDPSLNGD